MSLTENQTEEILCLFESDLKTLFKLVFSHNKPLDEADIRISSVILRKWLNEGLVNKLCCAMNVTPTFLVLDNHAAINEINQRPDIKYFLTGGIRFNGKPVMGIYSSTAAAQEVPPLPVRMSQVFMNTAKFLDQKRVFFEGDFFSCKDIIHFTANKLGGAHMDYKQDPRQQKMKRASEYISFGGPLDKINRSPPGELYFPIEPNGREILSGLHIEIVAAATSLISIHFDNEAFLDFEIRKTFRGEIRKFIKKIMPDRILLYDFKHGGDENS